MHTELTLKTAELHALRCAAVQKVTCFYQVNQTCSVCLEELQNGYNTAQKVVDQLNYQEDQFSSVFATFTGSFCL